MIDFDDLAGRARRYQASLDGRLVRPDDAAIAALQRLEQPFPEAPTAPAGILAELDEIGSPATMAATGGRYFGFVTGGVLPAALGADWLAAVWGQNAAMDVMSPIAARLEEIALRWIGEALHLPATGGALVTGATMANFTGLAAARETLLARQGWNVSSQGLFGAPPIPVVVGGEVHASMRKALSLLGLGKDRVIQVPVDGQGRMRPDAFPTLNQPAIVCLQAGNVNTGAFDPAVELIPLAKASNSWVHIDGAFGLWAAAAPARAHLMAGYDQADSWTTDAHKWLNAGYDCGIALLKDAAPLRDALDAPAAYLSHGSQRQPMHYTPESSRRARGVPVWAALKSLGKQGLADLVERCCRHAARFAEGLGQSGFEILNEVVLNQVMVSFGTSEQTKAVIAAIQEDGTCWCGSTQWQGHTAMRISVSSWATTGEDVARSLEAILRVARQTIDRGALRS
ncbi:pyridoxal phosphate-dependent decarboxylase family protein [Paludibaculum fermentans]|uniref:Aspartate aminotransferase family protein n=1 Tax=Paludibaculum fermentans TaxID=1473598 RepID=A0A7S7NMA8_PALFE|nr:pyridoxal-dependent decarboxylase [Paludibaculum fermentans]QOY86218.1 aspartate aminotransferase family protein [Paludibaculum fermentans]